MSVSRVINMVVVILVIVSIIPIGIQALLDTDTTGWPTLLITIWDFAPIMVGIAVLLGIIGFVQSKRGG